MLKTSFKKLMLVGLALAIFMPLTAKAFMRQAQQNIYIAEAQVVKGNFYAAASSITIDGKIEGDLICAAQSVVVNGTIEGDILCGAQSVIINGSIGDDVRLAANTVAINGKVGDNVMALAAVVTTGERADVGHDFLIGAASAQIGGKIAGSLHGGAGNIILGANIGKGVDMRVSSDALKDGRPSFVVAEEAKIEGNLIYTGIGEAFIANKNAVSGNVIHKFPGASTTYSYQNLLLGISIAIIWAKVIAIMGALLIGVLLAWLIKKPIRKLIDNMVDQPAKSMGWGIVFLFLTPVAAIFAAVTIIGLPLAFILAALWLIIIMLSKVILSFLVGEIIMGRYRYKLTKAKQEEMDERSLIWPLIIGVVVVYALFAIPFVGAALSIVGISWAIGSFMVLLKEGKGFK